MADPAVWRCPVCEGVNRGGRICTTCGEQLPVGFTPADATAPLERPTTGVAPPSPARPRLPTPVEIFGSDPFR